MKTRQRFVSLLVSKTSTNKSYVTIFADNVRILYFYLHYLVLLLLLLSSFLSAWSHGSWIYNYLCNQYLSPLTLWIQIEFMAGVYLIQHYMIKFISDLHHIGNFLWGFRLALSIKMTATIYSWNVIESGVKNPNPNSLSLLIK